MNDTDSLDNYTMIKVIGKGSYAKVVLVKHKQTDQLFALKILKKKMIEQKKQEEHIMTERNVLVGADHPFIIKLHHSFQNPRKLFFVLEYCAGGELFFLLSKRRQLTEDQARFYTGQMVLAIEYLHANGIIYRDLKPENVVLDNIGYIRITDFGLSKKNVLSDKDAFSLCGTPEYLAPEILVKEGYGKPIDWWTLGCIIYEMITGIPPFSSPNRQDLFNLIKTKHPKYPNQFSQAVKNLLDQLLDKNPEKRLGSGQMGAAAIRAHPWFEKMDWNALLNKQIMAPFKPILQNPSDTRNFDSEFTNMDFEESFKDNSMMSVEGKNFVNFSYNNNMNIE